MTGYTTNPLLNTLRRARRLLLLQPDDANEVFQVAGVKAPIRPGQRMVPGRGVYVADRIPAGDPSRPPVRAPRPHPG